MGRGARKSTYDHEDEIGEAGFEKDFCGHVLDEEVDAVDVEVHAGIEAEELEDLGIEVDFGGEVVYFDVDFSYVY